MSVPFVYLNEDGGIPILNTLRRHPAGVMGVRHVVVQDHPHGSACDCAIAQEIQWKIRTDGTVGCTPGWRPYIVEGKLVMFVRSDA